VQAEARAVSRLIEDRDIFHFGTTTYRMRYEDALL
jgi:hypothetical protein